MFPVQRSRPNAAPQTKVNRDKTDKIKKSSSSLASAVTASYGASPGLAGPKTLDASRDAWSNALGQMSQVRAVNPLTAIAQTAGMGLAGWGQGRATKQKEQGEQAFRAKFAQALKGGDPNAFAALMSDPYADESTQRMALEQWNRANPTEEERLRRQHLELQMKQAQQGMQRDQTTFQQQQDEYNRQLGIRKGREGQVQDYMGDYEEYKQQGGDLLPQGIQQMARSGGVEGVDPYGYHYTDQDERRIDRMRPLAESGDYDTAFQMMQSAGNKDELVEVGGHLYNTQTGEWMSPPGEDPKQLTDDLKEYERAKREGFTGDFMQFMTEIKKAAAPVTNIDLKQEQGYAKRRGEGHADMMNKADELEQSAFSALNTIDSMRQAMADENFYSGFGSDQLMQLRRATVAMGGDPDLVSSIETFQAQAKKLALDSMGGSLGTGFSNADRDFVTGQVPYLDNTPQGNAILLEALSRINKRKIDIVRKLRDYEMKNGQVDARALQELSMWAEENKLFPDVQGQARRPAAEMSDDEIRRALGVQ